MLILEREEKNYRDEQTDDRDAKTNLGHNLNRPIFSLKQKEGAITSKFYDYTLNWGVDLNDSSFKK